MNNTLISHSLIGFGKHWLNSMACECDPLSGHIPCTNCCLGEGCVLLPEIILMRGPTDMEFNEEAIVSGFYVHIQMKENGICWMDCMNLSAEEVVPPPSNVINIVRGWVEQPFYAGLSLQEWAIKTTLEDSDNASDTNLQHRAGSRPD